MTLHWIDHILLADFRGIDPGRDDPRAVEPFLIDLEESRRPASGDVSVSLSQALKSLCNREDGS